MALSFVLTNTLDLGIWIGCKIYGIVYYISYGFEEDPTAIELREIRKQLTSIKAILNDKLNDEECEKSNHQTRPDSVDTV